MIIREFKNAMKLVFAGFVVFFYVHYSWGMV